MNVAALPQRFLVGLILAVSTAGAGLAVETPSAKPPAAAPSTAKGTITVPGPLVLTPTELVLVDGRKVQGQLAAELDSHLIVYSPALGTIKSFRKEFVASYTKGNKPITISAVRALSPQELKVDLDWSGWVDAPPEKGPKPAYTTQKWSPPKRLLIWKTHDGKEPQKAQQKPETISGENRVKVAHFQGQDPANWLVLGTPLEDTEKWDLETDVILPGVSIDRIYSVHCPGRVFRHLMVENHAWIGFGDPSGMKVSGNFWIHERGRGGVSSVKPGEFIGASHTFCKNDRLPVCDLKGHNYDNSSSLLPNWDSRGYNLAQYIFIKKDPGISVEFLGSHVSGDKFWIFSGACILGPDSSVHSDTRNGDLVFKDASLHLLDGAILGKMKTFPLGTSVEVRGTLTAGLPDRPLTRDATIMLGRKDYSGVMGCGSPGDEIFDLLVLPGGQMRVHSADPKKARLVFQYSGFDQMVDGLPLAPWNSDGPRWASLPKRIETTFLGDVVLNGVLFKELHRGGIRLKDAGMTKAWTNVVFDASCQSQKPEDNYAVYHKGVPPVGWTEDPAVKNPVVSPGEQGDDPHRSQPAPPRRTQRSAP